MMLMTRGTNPFRTVLRPEGNGVLNRFSKYDSGKGAVYETELSRIRDITRAGFGIENDASGRINFKIPRDM